MRIRLSTVVVLSAAVISGVALIGMAQKVQVKESQVKALKNSISYEEQTIRVLQAEWAYLSRPARIEELARQYLQMRDAEATALLNSPETLPDLFVPALPVRKPAFFGGAAIGGGRYMEAAIRKTVPVPVREPAAVTEEGVIADTGRGFRSLIDELSDNQAGGK